MAISYTDVRYNNFQIIDRNISYAQKWSTDWHKFPGFPFILSLEESILPYGDDLHEFMQQKWHYSLYLSVVYMISLALLKRWMSGRESGYNLRTPMTIWSTFLALFSIFGVVRCLPEFVHILLNHGFTASFCKSCYYYDFRLTLWYLVFVLSKAAELIDTIFIVLRKQKLIALHWIHHVLTLCYSWYVFGDVPATARWMVNMNFLIHSLMYSYYALKAQRIPVPRMVNMSITTLQIVQMFFGLYINYQVVRYKLSEVPCDLSLPVAISGLALYSLFFMLFINFFVRAYILKPAAKTAAKTAKTISSVINDFNHNQCHNNNENDINNVVKKLQ